MAFFCPKLGPIASSKNRRRTFLDAYINPFFNFKANSGNFFDESEVTSRLFSELLLGSPFLRISFSEDLGLEPHKLIFYRTFAAQRFVRHICISKAGTCFSIHFSIFSRETTFLASAFGGLRESHPLSLHPRARFFFKKKLSFEI